MKKVVLIGSGNVATSLAPALAQHTQLAQIYSRRLSHARQLCEAVGCPNATDDLRALCTDADAYIISISDDAVDDVVDACPISSGIWMHTGGSIGLEVFAGKRERYGVLYPLQSFSREWPTKMAQVPLFVEGNDEATKDEIKALAQKLSENVYEATSEQREHLHLAAVFACNFANHMWALADEVLEEANLPREAMRPLIVTTAKKLRYMSAAESQTGPAMRGDSEVIAHHLQQLSGDKRDIYELLTKSIIARHAIELK